MGGAHQHGSTATGGAGKSPHPQGFARHDEAREHDHVGAGTSQTMRALALTFALTAGFAVVEGVAGWLAGSLALISDAGHMVTDAAALGLALFAQVVSLRPPSPRASYGYARAEVIAAFINGLALLALVVFIAVEAVQRLLHAEPVNGMVVIVVGAGGLAVNLLAAYMLSRASHSINTRAALLHVLSDLLGSVAAVVAGAVIVATGWTPIDPILSLVVALLILRSTWRLFAQSTGVLMESVPAHLDYVDIGNALSRIDGVQDVHDLHVWHMGADEVALSAHLIVADGTRWPSILVEAQQRLNADYGINHVTLQPSWSSATAPGDRRVIPIAPRSG